MKKKFKIKELWVPKAKRVEFVDMDEAIEMARTVGIIGQEPSVAELLETGDPELDELALSAEEIDRLLGSVCPERLRD